MDEFFRAMTPVLFANLLTVALVYGIMTASKSEQGQQGTKLGYGYAVGTFVFLMYGFYLYGAL